MIKQPFLFTLVACWLGLVATASADTRLVSTDASATELILALGYSEQLVAVDVTSQLPAGHRPLPNIGYHRNLSAEGLLSLQPSLIVGSEHMGPPSVIAALQQANIPVVRLEAADSSERLRNNIARLGDALSAHHQADTLLATLDSKLQPLQAAPSHRRMAFLLAMDPAKLRLAGQGTAGDAFIRLLGGRNVSDFTNYRNVSAESLMAMQADIILVAGQSPDNAVSTLLAAAPVLAHTPAGQHNGIVAVDGSTLVAGLSMAAIDEALRLQPVLHAAH